MYLLKLFIDYILTCTILINISLEWCGLLLKCLNPRCEMLPSLVYLDELHEPCSSTVPDLLKKIHNSLPSHSSVLLNVHSSTSEIYGKWNINGTVSVLQYCVLLYTIVYYYNGLERYEQFLQVGRLYRALILLGLALSSERLCVFGDAI